MRVVLAVMLVLGGVLSMTPAFAQFNSGGKGPSSMDIEMDRRKKAAEEADRGYKLIMKNTTPAKESKTDPWANARTPAVESRNK